MVGDGAGPGPNEVEPGPVGGRLQGFVGAWGDITSDQWVLQTVSSGYRIEFTESCRLTRAPLWTIVPAKHKHPLTLEEGLHKMLLKKAIVRLDPSTIGPGFYSSLFLVEKCSGGWRPILNLKRLNEGVKPPKFRMDTLQSVLNTLGADIKLYRDGCPPGAEVSGPWAVSLDLQDTYFHVSVDPRDTKYLLFAYEGEIFEFQVLPFGLSTAPRTFTRPVRAVGAYLKTLGINLFQYFDDWLVVDETYQLALSYRDTVRWVTQRVGFVLKEEKSDWVPSQFPLFLGSSLDLVRLLAFPSEDRIDRLQRLIRRVLKSLQAEQHPGRCAVEGQLLPDGVDPSQVEVRVPVAGVGASVCGHVRLGEECPTPGILLPGIGSPGQRVERADHELGHDSRLCVPSDRTDPAGSEKTSQTPVGDDRPTCAILAQPDLVQTDDQSLG